MPDDRHWWDDWADAAKPLAPLAATVAAPVAMAFAPPAGAMLMKSRMDAVVPPDDRQAAVVQELEKNLLDPSRDHDADRQAAKAQLVAAGMSDADAQRVAVDSGGAPPTPEGEAARRAQTMPGAPVEEPEQPKPLGFEDWVDFDPATDIPFAVVGGEKAKGQTLYYDGVQNTAWGGMGGEKGILATKALLWRKGYYGSALPSMSAVVQGADTKALAAAMADSNRSGGLGYEATLTRLPDVYGAKPEDTTGSSASGAGSSGSSASGSSYTDPAVARQQARADRLAAQQAQFQQTQLFDNAVTSLRSFAQDNGVRMPEDFIGRRARAVAKDRVPLDTVVADLRDKFVARAFPAFADEIRAGADVRDIAAPYTSAMSDLLELPDAHVDLRDPLLRGALQNVDDKGEHRPVPLWQFEQQVKKDPRWESTDNAWAEIGGRADALMKTFGMA